MKIIACLALFFYIAVVQNLHEFYDMGVKAGHIIDNDKTYYWFHDWARYAIAPVLALGWASKETGVLRVGLKAIAFSYILDCIQRFVPGGNLSGWYWECASILLCIAVAAFIEWKKRPKVEKVVRVKGFK